MRTTMLAMALAAATASRPPAACAPVADAWCNGVRPDNGQPLNCDASVSKGPLVALFDTDAEGGPAQWRCYSRSTLDPTGSKYVSGTAYCSRQDQIADLLRTCAAGVETTVVPVFNHGETDTEFNRTYPCIRIPAVVPLHDGTLLATAECRHWIGDGCDPVGSRAPRLGSTDWRDMCIKTSADGGRTWSSLRTIANCTDQPTPVVIPPPAGQKGPGTIVVHGNRCGADPTHPRSNVQLTSSDGGATWTPPVLVSEFLGPNVDGSYVGPGVGLRLSDAHPVAPGRLLFIGHHGAYQHDYVWYSDDGARTWNVSETPSMAGMDEAQLVEVPASAAEALGFPAGAVLANMRSDHLNRSCDCRAQAVSVDGGATFSPLVWAPQLISPVCQATIVSGAAPSGSGGALYFANPASRTGRVNGTVRVSTDGAGSWSDGLLLSSAGYAYSCLTPPMESGADAWVGVLWETDGASFECNGVSCRSVFSRVPLSALA